MNLLDFLFPKKCIGCERLGEYVCETCSVGMWEEEQLPGLTCLWAYEGLARKLISKAKYDGRYDYLKFLIYNFQFTNNSQFSNFQKFLKQKPTVVPVPLHKNRLRERGFNQAEIIAKVLASRHTLAYNGHLLYRVKDTGHQVGRTRSERLKALENSMKIVNCKLKIPQAVLLVDDVWTTGATMNECTKTLRAAGVKNIWKFVLAR
ncbi:ComF family protein [Candidatus Amesbacteria bacterium]|nr:ComF family protein [Candidatus Amesbacteria bacterium]